MSTLAPIFQRLISVLHATQESSIVWLKKLAPNLECACKLQSDRRDHLAFCNFVVGGFDHVFAGKGSRNSFPSPCSRLVTGLFKTRDRAGMGYAIEKVRRFEKLNL